MSYLFRQFARYVAQKAAANPVVREKAAKAARVVVEEGKQVIREDDRAYAAGRAVRRMFDRIQGER